VVSREELRQRLWPNETQVEFEHSINAAVNRLRQVLGDSADKPRYIETLARRGYRWRASVIWSAPVEASTADHATKTPIEALIGKRVSHYRILELLGGGGMGVVFKAEDLKLGRRVALKFLPEELATDPAALRRFEREARAASGLDHPNICTIYEFSEHDGQPFIVMQFLDGQTIRDRMEVGLPFSWVEIAEVAIQVTEGLQVAHQNGIIHRDIKPANIFLTTRGEAKLLDFGLAKLTDPTDTQEIVERMRDPSLSAPANTLTMTGKTMGTASYMSPEQVRGEKLDARTDIFSFGLVLYEIATGHRAFTGETATLVHEAILRQEPPSATKLKPEVPVELEKIIVRCLAKDRESRYATAEYLLVDLQRVKRGLERTQQVSGRKRVWIIGAIAMALLGAALVGGWWLLGRRSASALPPVKLVPLATNVGAEGRPALSPDGSQIAFMWNGGEGEHFDIYVKLVDEAAPPLRLTHSPGAFAGWPVWSPDGHRIAFLRCTNNSASIFLISALGGAERKIAEPRFCPGIFDWSPDGRSLAFSDKDFAEQPDSIFLVSLETGNRRRLTTPGRLEQDFEPKFSPDGKAVAFVRVHDLIVGDIFLVPVEGGEPRRVTSVGGDFAGLTWTHDGQEIVFAYHVGEYGGLWRIKVKGGTPERVAEAAAVNASEPAISRQANRLAYRQISTNSNIWRLPLPFKGKRSVPVKLISSTRSQNVQQYSPDGRKIVFASDRSGTNQIWVCDADGSNPVQLTFMNAPNVGTPRWSPDGRSIVFDSTASGHNGVYLIGSDGGKPQPLVVDSHFNGTPSFSRNGRWVYFVSDRGGKYQVWKVNTSGGDPIQITSHGGFFPMESLDGRFLYYVKDANPLPPSKGHLWRMSVTGGTEEQVMSEAITDLYWALSPAGIYFIDPDTKPHATLKFFSFPNGPVKVVTELEKPPSCCGQALAVSPDRQSILYGQEDNVTTDIILVDNFR
jgi:Tol biopolymer transport system component/serine/threonine protein kinase